MDGQFGQFTLGKGQYGRSLARGRQAQQGGHAVGFDLQQALHQAAQTALRHATCQQHHARETVSVDGKVGIDLAVPVGHGGGQQRVLMQHMLDQRARAEGVGGQHPQVQAAQALAGQCRQPLARHRGDGAHGLPLTERFHRRRHHEGPGNEFGMQFPA